MVEMAGDAFVVVCGGGARSSSRGFSGLSSDREKATAVAIGISVIPRENVWEQLPSPPIHFPAPSLHGSSDWNCLVFLLHRCHGSQPRLQSGQQHPYHSQLLHIGEYASLGRRRRTRNPTPCRSKLPTLFLSLPPSPLLPPQPKVSYQSKLWITLRTCLKSKVVWMSAAFKHARTENQSRYDMEILYSLMISLLGFYVH